MTKSSSAVIIILIIGIYPSFSQSPKVVNQNIEWFSATGFLKIKKNLTIYGDSHFRFVNGFQPMQFQARIGLDIAISKKFSVMPLGYAYIWNPIYGEQPAAFSNNEYRFFQQIQFKHSVGKLKFQQRLRPEERFLEQRTISNGEVINEGYINEQFRIRYRLLCNIPLSEKGIAPGAWFIQAFDEVFISWGKSVSSVQPDQNRLFTGVGYQFSSNFSIQAGLLYQLFIKPNGIQQENNFGSSVYIVYNLDLTNQD